MAEDWIAEVEERFQRFATDEHISNAEWETVGVRLAMDAYRLVFVAKAAAALVESGGLTGRDAHTGDRMYAVPAEVFEALAAAVRGEGA